MEEGGRVRVWVLGSACWEPAWVFSALGWNPHFSTDGARTRSGVAYGTNPRATARDIAHWTSASSSRAAAPCVWLGRRGGEAESGVSGGVGRDDAEVSEV